jgi:outer membrane protein TolC
MRTRLGACLVVMLGSLAPLCAQPAVRQLSLDDAIRLATDQSEEVRIAQSGVTRAEGSQTIARSGYLPQISASVSYTRTLLSQYSGISTSSITGSSDTSKSGSSSSSLLKNLPFGQKNNYSIGIQLVQNIFTGGRLTNQEDAADARRRSADIDLTAAQAQLILNITQAYYDAVLSDQLVIISDSSLAQTEEILRQTEVAYKVGAKPEFELLRARVARDNQVPVLLQRRNDRTVAYYRLKQLLNISLDDSLQLTSGVQEENARFATVSDTATDQRATVRQAMENVKASEAGVKVAESSRWPLVQFTSRFAPVAYPEDILPTFSDFRTDWTVGLTVSMPLFTGGAIGGNEQVAQGTLDEAQARLRQAREGAALDARMALNDMAQAEATLHATNSTVEQATRAYSIAEIRFREGISTQLELSDSRLLLEQSRANNARAVRNYQVARVKLSLLRDLPLGASGAQGSSAAAAAAQQGAAAQAAQSTTGSGQPTQGSSQGGGGAVPGVTPTATGNF